MKKLTLAVVSFVLFFAANAQAAVFYSDDGDISRITDVSITATYAPWAPTYMAVFDVDIVVGIYADAYSSGGLPPGWETGNQGLGLATAATYGLAEALKAGGAPVTKLFLGGEEELYVPFFFGDVVSGSAPTCFGCVQSRTTYAWSAPIEWRPAAYTAVDPGGTARAWALFTPVTDVPVPAAAWLFGSALLGLTGLKRRNA